MSLKYSCIKNKFKIDLHRTVKNPPTEKNTFIQKEASKSITSSKIRGPKDFSKLI